MELQPGDKVLVKLDASSRSKAETEELVEWRLTYSGEMHGG